MHTSFGVEDLRRTDGVGWEQALKSTLLDSHGSKYLRLENLRALDRSVNLLLADLECYPLPELIIHPKPSQRESLTLLAFMSMMVADRAERLTLAVELTAGALVNLEQGAIALSALSARALLELAIVCEDGSDELSDAWALLDGRKSQIRREIRSTDSAVVKAVWETRFGTRLYVAHEGYPSAINIATRLKRIAKVFPRLQGLYDGLCDVAHPNVEAHASLWRAANRAKIDGFQVIEFSAGRSNTPRKADVVDAVIIGINMILPYTRDLWWIAASAANSCDVTVTTRTRRFGIPARTAMNDYCSCGSGAKTAGCRHPRPIYAPHLGP